MGCAAASTAQYPGFAENSLLPRSDSFAPLTLRGAGLLQMSPKTGSQPGSAVADHCACGAGSSPQVVAHPIRFLLTFWSSCFRIVRRQSRVPYWTQMAAPPTITENGALFLAQQATMRRSQRPSPRFLRLLGAVWSATRARFVRRRCSLAEKTAVALLKMPRPKGREDAKMITVVRTIRRP